jgi:hypothetical protein
VASGTLGGPCLRSGEEGCGRRPGRDADDAAGASSRAPAKTADWPAKIRVSHVTPGSVTRAAAATAASASPRIDAAGTCRTPLAWAFHAVGFGAAVQAGRTGRAAQPSVVAYLTVLLCVADRLCQRTESERAEPVGTLLDTVSGCRPGPGASHQR